MTLILLSYFLLAVIAFIVTSFLLFTKDIFTGDAPVIFSREESLKKLFEVVAIREGSTLLDIGSGDGRVLTEFLKMHPHSFGIGIEKGLFPYLLSLVKIRQGKVTLHHFDIFDTRKGDLIKKYLGDATHIFLYLYPEMLKKLAPILVQNVSKGTTVICLDFPLPGRSEDESFLLSVEENGYLSSFGKKVFVYRY